MATAKSRGMDAFMHAELDASEIPTLAELLEPDAFLEDLLKALREHRQDGCNRWYCFGSTVLADLLTRDVVDLNVAVHAALRRILKLEGELAQLRQSDRDE